MNPDMSQDVHAQVGRKNARPTCDEDGWGRAETDDEDGRTPGQDEDKGRGRSQTKTDGPPTHTRADATPGSLPLVQRPPTSPVPVRKIE